MVVGQLPVSDGGGVTDERQRKSRNVSRCVHVSLCTHVAVDNYLATPTQWQPRVLQEFCCRDHTHSGNNDLTRQGLPRRQHHSCYLGNQTTISVASHLPPPHLPIFHYYLLYTGIQMKLHPLLLQHLFLETRNDITTLTDKPKKPTCNLQCMGIMGPLKNLTWECLT